MTDNTQPEAGSTHIIRYALEMGLLWIKGDGRDKVCEALDALDTLETQIEAIGAGGVSGPLIGQPQAMPDLSQLTERGAVALAGVDAQGLREGRWYMVTHDGVATLCEDRRDAEKEAKDADMAWPHSGPHRAVQLVEASMAGYTAADMATAAAQGFRDGAASLAASAPAPSEHIKEPYTLAEVKAKIASNDYSAEMLLQHAMALLDSASLAASAGSEPVAWRYRSVSNGNWEDCTKEVHDMVLRAPQQWAGYEVQPLYTHPSPPEGMVAEQALRKVLSVVQRYLPPDGPTAHDAMTEITEIVDPWPLGPLEKP